ncbi:MAG: hypothetical protein ACI9OJ_002024 [Myxococcota bacterium]|jgi:hypothetical protein
MSDNMSTSSHRRPVSCSALGLFVLAATVLGGTTLLPETADARWVRYAVVIGHNQSDDPNLAPLRYADDDAVKHAALLKMMTEKTVLLADLDEPSRRTFGAVKTKAPTRSNIMDALRDVRADMAKDLKRGDKPVLYFVYSGHGNYDQEGRGYVHIQGGRLTTRDLYYDVLGPSEGSSPHHVVLMVDACNAALLVNSRGSDRRKVRSTSLKLEAYPNVGVILSASSVGEVHEWGKLLSGIFSHELRSAMLGAADINDDREISFPELAAFIASANAQVKNEVYRLKPYIRPPLSAPNMPLISLDDARFPARIRLDGKLSGRAHLLDRELLRYADFNKPAGHGFWLALPGSDGFILVHDGKEYLVDPGARGDIQLSDLRRRDQTVLSKRGAHEYFEARLFAQPHAPAGAAAWLETEYEKTLVVERFELVPWYENNGAWAVLGGGLASMTAAGVLHGLAQSQLNELSSTPQNYWYNEARSEAATAATWQNTAYGLYAVGAASIIGSVLWFALDRKVETTRYVPPLEIDVTPTGVLLRKSF